MGIFSDPSFLFYLDFLSRKLSFLYSIYFCSGFHLKFGVLRVFPGQVSFTVNIVFQDNVLFCFPVKETLILICVIFFCSGNHI